MVADALTALPRSTNIAGMKRNAIFVALQVMGVAVLMVLKKSIGMEALVTNAGGVVLLHQVVVVPMVQIIFMRNNLKDMSLQRPTPWRVFYY